MNQNSDFDSDILIIDNIGMLSSLYAYGHIAYIGGGFGAGIHNTLEAAVFGMPIIFGPNFGKFSEAVELIKKQAAFSVSSKKEFFLTMEKMYTKEYRNTCGENSDLYVKENIGASESILEHILF
jgi:3-deoxy-D-manno-octulosonic-acid transferase